MELGLSGTKLARMIGKSQPYISDLERGKRLPSLQTLQALSIALEKPAAFFLADEERPPKQTAARAIPIEARQQFAEHIADQLLATALLNENAADVNRDELVRAIEQAVHNAYYKVRLTPQPIGKSETSTVG